MTCERKDGLGGASVVMSRCLSSVVRGVDESFAERAHASGLTGRRGKSAI